MSFLLFGLALLACIVGLFWLKNLTRKEWLARLAYSEPVARLTVIAAALIVIGAIASIVELFG